MKTIGLAALAVIVAVLLTFFIQEYRWKAKLAAAPRDTTIVTHPEYTLPYVAQGPVVSKLPKPIIQDTVSNYNKDSVFNSVERGVLLNIIGKLNVELADLREVDEFREDSARYSLAVLYDPQKSRPDRFWRWLEIKAAQYTDTTTTITQTVTLERILWPWMVASFAVGMVIMALFYVWAG